jgi:putative transposase
LARSSYYYEPRGESEENLVLMRLLDEQYTRTPFYGARKMAAWLHTQGYPVERRRVRRLLLLMGLEALYPKPRTSQPGATAQRYPYLLRGMSIERCNQVWSCDITYIRLQRGFIYLMAVIDWKRPLRVVVGNLDHPGYQLLPGSAGSGLARSHP